MGPLRPILPRFFTARENTNSTYVHDQISSLEDHTHGNENCLTASVTQKSATSSHDAAGCACAVRAQDGRWNFNIGGGIGFPTGDLGKFINNGGNFVVGGGYNVNHWLSTNGEFMWQDLPVNSSTKDALQTPGASARQYATTFDPMVHFPLGHKLGAYAIGGIGWYHRSGETTTPGAAVICDPYWSWWYGCTIGEVNIVTGSTSADAFGENIGGGLTYRFGKAMSSSSPNPDITTPTITKWPQISFR